ncbi:MAG: HD domain-containing protein [Eubacteriales bacterium]|nr:HD domain-containing protein [Eubacteriales bacterium]
MAKVTFPLELLALARFFYEAGTVLYAVGGQVRNQLLGYPVRDRDICSAMTPDKVMEMCEKRSLRYVPQGVEFGTVLLCPGNEAYEHTTFRRDVYEIGGAHKPKSVAFGESLSQDAFRRDFTVNALYAHIRTGEVLDPTRRGLDDLSHGVICATTPDPEEIMRDDALRVLRMVRFACELGFSVEGKTFEAAKKYAKGLKDISAERIRDELSKILLSDIRYGANGDIGTAPGEDSPVYKGLVMLDKLGALDVILPALTAGRYQVQRLTYHAYTVLYHNLHTAACLDVAGYDEQTALACRLAALLHDVGKPEAKRRNDTAETETPAYAAPYTPTEQAARAAQDAKAENSAKKDEKSDEQTQQADRKPANAGHMYGHDAISAQMAREILTQLRYPAAIVDEACALIAHHMYDLTGYAKESTLRERFAQWGYEHSLRVARLREADVYGSGRTKKGTPVETAMRFQRVLMEMRQQHAPFGENELDCTGEDIMAWLSLKPSKRVGELKRALLLHCAKKPADNKKEKLQRLCQDMKKTPQP